MFEDFRKQIDDSSFTEDDEGQPPDGAGKPPRGNILGMSPAQRFIVSFMLLIMTVILGILFLMVTNRIALPSSL